MGRQVRQQMEEQVAQKSSELEQYLQRVHELENMYGRLEDALEDERRARQDEEAVRRLQARWVQSHRATAVAAGGQASVVRLRKHAHRKSRKYKPLLINQIGRAHV